MTKKNRILFIVNTLLGILAICTQLYLLSFYTDKMPIFVTIISMVSLLAYFFISFYSLFSISKLEITSRGNVFFTPFKETSKSVFPAFKALIVPSFETLAILLSTTL